MKIDAKYVNPLIISAKTILKKICKENATLSKIYYKESPYASSKIIVMIGITGDLHGQVMFSLEESAACYVASKMMMGIPVTELDEMSLSALSELTNMILGTSATAFYNDGIEVNITPPSIVVGFNMQVSADKVMKIMCVPLILANGDSIEMDIMISVT